MDSILDSIKKMLGIDPTYTEFDTELIILTSTVLSTLSQVAIKPNDGFKLTDKTQVWDDWFAIPDDMEMIKTYIYLRVKLIFDPPQSSSVMKAYEETKNEFEWRIRTAMELHENEEVV